MAWVVVCLLAAGVVAFLIFRARTPDSRPDPGEDRCLAAVGPVRCQEALALLAVLTARPGRLPQAWDRIELPLLEALPDCPPELKPDLRRALDAAALACRHRETAKRIVTMRNALLGEASAARPAASAPGR